MRFIMRKRNRSDKPSPKTFLVDAFNHFQIRNRTENRSPSTVDWYAQVFKILFTSQWGIPPQTEMGELTDLRLQSYIASLGDKMWRGKLPKASTLANRVRALRAFFRWAYKVGYTETLLLETTRPPKIPFELIEPLTDQEIWRLFDASPKLRDKAVLALLLDSGLRAAELVGIYIDDLNLEKGVVKVMGKGAKERYVPFGEATERRVRKYIDEERPKEVLSDRLFLTNRRKPMKTHNLKLIMRRLKDKAEIPRIHAHLLRHTFATRFLLGGGNMLLLKACLGHTSMTMVDRYVHLASQEAIDLGRMYSPLDGLENGTKSRSLNIDDDLGSMFQEL